MWILVLYSLGCWVLFTIGESWGLEGREETETETETEDERVMTSI